MKSCGRVFLTMQPSTSNATLGRVRWECTQSSTMAASGAARRGDWIAPMSGSVPTGEPSKNRLWHVFRGNVVERRAWRRGKAAPCDAWERAQQHSPQSRTGSMSRSLEIERGSGPAFTTVLLTGTARVVVDAAGTGTASFISRADPVR